MGKYTGKKYTVKAILTITYFISVCILEVNTDYVICAYLSDNTFSNVRKCNIKENDSFRYLGTDYKLNDFLRVTDKREFECE